MGRSGGRPINGRFYVDLDHTRGKWTVTIYDQNGPNDVVIAQGSSTVKEEIAAGKAFLAWMEHIFLGGREKKG